MREAKREPEIQHPSRSSGLLTLDLAHWMFIRLEMRIAAVCFGLRKERKAMEVGWDGME